MARICGIDEAGRGPVIGPLVICGYLIEAKQEKDLERLGVKDSKMLTREQREALFPQLVKLGTHKLMVVEPAEIDAAVQSQDGMNLNWLEAAKAADIINALQPDIVYLDCPSPNIPAFTEYVQKLCTDPAVEIVAEHKADVHYPSVSAASILAKVTRDRLIDELKRRYDADFGSGYPSDPATKEFLEERWDDPKYPFFRKSWASYTNIAKKRNQRSLGDF